MILAFKTADLTTQLYIIDATGKVVNDESWDSGRSLSDQILAKIHDFLKQHNSQITDLTGIVVFSGPGSFTSLRIGHTVGNALADSLGIPVVGAAGEHWHKRGAAALKTAKPGRPALPHYGAEAHITRPKP